MVYGDRKPFLTALITLDVEETKTWAQGQGVPADDFQELCRHPRVEELVAGTVQEKNRELASYEQVKYFRILSEEFTQENGTLTATLKVRRREVVRKYGDLLEEFYKN